MSTNNSNSGDPQPMLVPPREIQVYIKFTETMSQRETR